MERIVYISIIYLIFKHFIADFLLQSPFPYIVENKSKYGHIAGILHSTIHIILSLPLAIYFGIYYPLAIEFAIHYNIDWLKAFISKKMSLSEDSSVYWFLIGLDQMIHYLNYILSLFIWLEN